MRKEHKNLLKRAASVAAGVALAFACIACSKPAPSMATDINEETGAITCTVENADSSTSTTTAFKLGENEVFLVSPVLDKGTVRVDLYVEGSENDPKFSVDASGRVLDTYTVDPGEYVVRFTGTDSAPATGSVLVYNQNVDELKAQNDSLKESLEAVDEGVASAVEGTSSENKVVKQ